MRATFRNKTLAISSGFLLLVTLAAVAAPYLTSFSYEEQNIEARLEGPSAKHPMGTDSLGRDLYSRILYGARASMAVGFVTALCAVLIGTVYGAVAGWVGGWVDAFLMRVVDIFYVFPSLLIAILLMVVLGQGITGILIALALVGWVNQARLVRAQVLQVKEHLHVEAARAAGAGGFRIVGRHILPLILGPVMVSLTFQIPTSIMAESFLSFLGLGLQPPYSSWGTLAAEGFRGMRSYPHLIIFPGVALFLTMLAFQFLGDGLRDLLDPTTRS
ncbi:MAG: ABC transporter permease [Deltaproteobacteria bacterium]|nr:ABC transporter permease [Deltaproteobacteria bacterium]